MKIKHYIITRFFCVNGPLGDKLFDENFLKTRFYNLFVPNMIKSINKIEGEFDLLILIHDDIEYDKIEFLNECKSLLDHPVVIMRKCDLSSYIYNDILDKDFDYVCESRMDFDDFVFSGVLKDIQSHIDVNIPVKMYGYTNGYTYNTFTNTLHLFDWTFNRKDITGHWSVCYTIILSKAFALDHKDLTIYSIGDHGKTKLNLAEYCKNHGIDFKESMFEYNNEIDAFVYYRHPDAFSIDLVRVKDPNFTPDIMPQYMARPLHKKVSQEYLKDRFSFEFNIPNQNTEE